MIQRISICLLSFMLFFSLFLQAEMSNSTNLNLYVENQTIEAGKPFWAALQFKIDEGWHIYGEDPGDFGQTPTFEWTLPDGFQIDEILWPEPQKFVSDSITTYGYEEEATLLIKIIPPKGLPNNFKIKCDAMWVACDEGNCLPQSTHLSVDLKPGNGELNADVANIFAKAKDHNETDSSFLLFALGMAFLGGLILNLMPCVLPVISLKVLSFVKMSGSNPRLILKHSLLFSAGVIISFWILSAFLLFLKSWGHSVGWGFQLQEPLFVAILAGVFFVLALSLFGVFELGTGFAAKAGQAQTKANSGLSASFFSGILATAIATPCSGPLLGYAIGLAFTIPFMQAMLVFSTIGLGMAFPYLLVGAFPELLKYLPKPGNWMITFKEIMGFFMLATVLWLVWVFAAQTDNDALIALLLSFFFLGIACWVFGKWGAPFRKKQVRIYGIVVACAFIAISGYILHGAVNTIEEPLVYDSDTQLAMLDPNEIKSGWEKFSPERVAELRAQGVPVFVDFTARWCGLCQKNHRTLVSKEVTQKFDELGVVKMKADWTKKDDVITKELQKFGRSSVPLYVFYDSDPAKEPKILPQWLTVSNVIGALDN